MTDTGRGKLIVVDDDARVLDVTTLLLRDAGYDVSAFAKASDALAELQAAGADAVISDIVMPEMNGIEATPRNGSVSVHSSASADRGVLIIADTGPGIPADLLGRIFDPLFSTKEHRFGMGLALAKQVFAEHLGEVTVRSEPATGTVFTISFPLRWSDSCGLGLPEAGLRTP